MRSRDKNCPGVIIIFGFPKNYTIFVVYNWRTMAELNVVERLSASIDKVLDQYTLATEEVARLQMLADAQQRKIRTLQQQLSDAERALAQAKLSSAFIGSGEDVKAAKAQINRLLREVEKCIELVSAKV